MAARGALYSALPTFKRPKDAGAALDAFDKYIKRANMIFDTEDIEENKKKKALLQLWGGDEMITFFEHEGKVTAEDTYAAAIDKIRNSLKGQINEVYPVFKLFCEMPQGQMPFTEWYTKVLDQANLCNFANYTAKKAARDAMTMQTNNHKLRKHALAEGAEFDDFVKYGIALESSSSQAQNIEKQESVNWVGSRRAPKKPNMRDSSGRGKQTENVPKICDFCGYERKRAHAKGKCPAKGKRCNDCKKKHHFAKSPVCPGPQDADVNALDSESSESDEEHLAGRILTVSFIPLVNDNDEIEMIDIEANGTSMKMRVDSGCKKTLIPEKDFRKLANTTRLFKSKVKLRPYGTKDLLKVKGRAKIELTTTSGATSEQLVYVIEGGYTEPLLGLEASLELGVLEIHPEGHRNANDPETPVYHVKEPEKLPTSVMEIIDKHQSLFEGIGKFNKSEINFDIDESVKPMVQKERQIPFAFRKQVTDHLKELKDNDIIEGPLDPSVKLDWISNVVITKKPSGQIRMNLDMRHANIAIKESHIPVPTVHSLRHKLNGAKVFTKLDMRHSFHQMPLGEKSKELTNFYTHEGIYRFKRLVMGAGPASQEFHERLRQSIVDLMGVEQIEDDLLVYGASQQEHDTHLNAVLDRLQSLGLTLRKEKCVWSAPEVIWFGYKFSREGMSADPSKIETIVRLAPPTNAAEVKSFLQMCQYNALFMFGEPETYSDITAPLRNLTRKKVPFKWDEACQNAFQKLKEGLCSDRVIAPWAPDRKTKLVVDRGPKGISATLFQKEPDTGHYKTINYSSRSLTETEQRYAPIEGESLAILFGVKTNRMYLHGMKFDTITDHEPLVSLYNNQQREAPARIENHRLKLQQYRMTVKYEKGSTNPTDYNSRHPLPINDHQRREANEETFHINAIIDDDIPDAMTFDMVRKATNADDQLARLKYCILEKGYIPKNATDLQPFRHVFGELSVARQVVLRGERLVIPESLQPEVIALAHKRHQGASKMKRYLRSKVSPTSTSVWKTLFNLVKHA